MEFYLAGIGNNLKALGGLLFPFILGSATIHFMRKSDWRKKEREMALRPPVEEQASLT